MSPAHARKLMIIGIVMFVCIPFVLAAWIVPAYFYKWDVVSTARGSAVCIMVWLALCIYFQLFLKYPWKEKKRGFIFYWFCTAALFNIVWQVPLILFRSFITQADLTQTNLLKFSAWWGYGFADSHYGLVDKWMMSEETWWFLAIVISIVGLVLIKRGRETNGFLLLGIAGMLQAYNASLYMVFDAMTGFDNIASGSALSLVLYWGFNPMWALTALVASIFSFQFVLSKVRAGRAGLVHGGKGER
jgi:hypothetical protein